MLPMAISLIQVVKHLEASEIAVVCRCGFRKSYPSEIKQLSIRVGFERVIPLKEFADASNGYLVDDTCVFGEEVFVCKERRAGKAECLPRINNAVTVSKENSDFQKQGLRN
ncbi:hypothetical protein L3X38_002003 [Prunus dulcis]|uniref:Uncharacterized protein n=1 Tax=Prunus dulcis TaxID=3755 RepID=A0AAD4ZKR2_PRUDU|nr:hypothetical protein L3X38_002003 [Prunus dulcis]